MIDYHSFLWWMVVLIFRRVFFISFFPCRSSCLVLGPVIEVDILVQIVLDLDHHGLRGLRVICGLHFRWRDAKDFPRWTWGDKRLKFWGQGSLYILNNRLLILFGVRMLDHLASPGQLSSSNIWRCSRFVFLPERAISLFHWCRPTRLALSNQLFAVSLLFGR